MTQSETLMFRVGVSAFPHNHLPAWEVLYYLAFSCILIWQGVSWTTLDSILFLPIDTIKLLVKGLFVLFALSVFILRKKTVLEIAFGVSVGSALLLSALICKDRDLLFAFILVFLGRGVSFKRIANITLVFMIVLTTLTLAHGILGLTEIRFAIDTDGRGMRSAWGFTHPNRFAFSIFLIIFCWLAIRFPHCDARDFVGCSLAFAAVFFFIKSRTSALMILLLVLVVYKYQANYSTKDIGRKSCLLLLIGGGALIALSLYAMIFYEPSNPLYVAFDKALSGRINLAHEYFVRFPPTLFGTSFENVAARTSGFDSSLVVDNAYARLVILYGILPAGIWILSFVALCVKGIKENTASLPLVLYGVMIFLGVSESMTLPFTSNIALLALTTLIPGSLEQKDKARRQ